MAFDADKTLPSWKAPQAARPDPGLKQLGSYRIERLLGEGGMGRVYLATHVTMNRQSALKLLPEELAKQSSFVERFQREAQVLANLDHRAIVKVHYFDRQKDHFFLDMEYVEGGDLQQRIEQQSGPGLPPQEVKRLLRDILSAVEYAHKRNVIHRDLKPGNILLKGGGAVKVSDFGLAAVVGEDFQKSLIEKSITLSQVGNMETMQASAGPSGGGIAGTLLYMSPQAIRGESPRPQDDLYAVGVIAYYMLTGRTPTVNFKPPSKQVKGLSRRWDRFIQDCLEEDLDERFATATDALQALEKIPEGGGKGLKAALWALPVVLLCGAATAAYFTLADGPSSEPVPLPDELAAQSAPGSSPQGSRQPQPDLLPPRSPGTPLPATPRNVDPATLPQATLRLVGRPEQLEIRILGLPGGQASEWQSIELPRLLRIPATGEAVPLEARAIGFAPGSYTVRVEGGQILPINIELAPLRMTRRFSLSSTPSGAEVWLGDDRLGTTPLERAFTFNRTTPDVAWQERELLLRFPGHSTERVRLQANAASDVVRVALTPVTRALIFELPGGVQLRTTRIDPGRFTMGSPPNEIGRKSDEEQRSVTIERPFLMATTEVTQALWESVMGGSSNPSFNRFRSGNYPVEQVRLGDILGSNGFLARLNAALQRAGYTDWEADLPTEAEWEYACRAGTTTAFNDGSSLRTRGRSSSLDRLAVYGSASTQSVASFEPNAWGLYDMHGNVWEWTLDGVLRGGSFEEGAASCRSAARLHGFANSNARDRRFGLRVVLRPR